VTAAGPLTSPLISTAELAERLEDADLRIVDARWYLGKPGAGRAAYLEGHIPGAIHLDLDADLSDLAGFGAPGRHPLPDPATFAERMGRAGIGTDTLVVAYDDSGGWVAARLWWMLDNLGHAARGGVRVLDGGWQAWTGEGRPVSTDVPTPEPQEVELGDRWTRVIARGELADRLGSVTLLDARAPARYRGEIEPVDPVAGHIPTALSAPWEANLGPNGRFLPPEALRQRFEAFDAFGSGELVASCGSGTSACHHVLAARVAGVSDPVLYVGSYSDWSRSNMPIAVGPEPGPRPA